MAARRPARSPETAAKFLDIWLSEACRLYNPLMRPSLLTLLLAGLLAAAPGVQVKLAPEAGSIPRDGRLIVVVSKQMQGEPRFQVTWGVATQQIFGKDVDGWKPGDTVEMGADTPDDPLHTLKLGLLPTRSRADSVCSSRDPRASSGP
jgi:hypothetical protein